jgi:RND family efflux transporter MFP subunit
MIDFWRSIVTVALIVAPAMAHEARAAGDAAASVLVTTETPRQGTLNRPVTAYGVVAPAPAGAISVASLHAAQVAALRISLGQVVRRGDPLLDLGADPAASLAFAQARSDVDLARAELARTRQMAAEHLATLSQVDQAAKAERDAEATLEARRREGGGTPVETVISPVAGIVTAIAVGNGDHVQPGAALVSLARADGLVAMLGVTPEERPRIRPGVAVDLVDLDAPGAPVAAAILTVGGMADAKTGLVPVTAAPRASVALTAGAHLHATIQGDAVAGWIVPRDAVLTDADGPHVFQIEDGKAHRIAIGIVGGAGDALAVSGAIDGKRPLVVSGNYQLADGMAVREADTAPSAGEPSHSDRNPGGTAQ